LLNLRGPTSKGRKEGKGRVVGTGRKGNGSEVGEDKGGNVEFQNLLLSNLTICCNNNNNNI